MSGATSIVSERQRQIDQEGFGSEHDDKHRDGILAQIAGCIALDTYDDWDLLYKHHGNRIRQLEIAGALIAAEIDRLERI